MIKSLKDARIVDGLPRIVAQQAWVSALSGAVGEMHQKTLEYIDGSQIYTLVDSAEESVLDAIAVNWKIDWYDTEYNIEQKRRIVKTAMKIRRTMGTVGALKAQADAIYPGTTLEEWFNWGGEPGWFRLYVDVTTTGEGNTIDLDNQAETERRLTMAKRFSAHLESMSYQIKHAIKTNSILTMWRHKPPLCATVRCGVYHTVSTLGWSERTVLATAGVAETFLATPEVSGTVPQTATVGYSLCGALIGGGIAEVFAVTPPENGIVPSGTHHAISTLGWSGGEKLAATGIAEAFTATPPENGTLLSGVYHAASTLGWSEQKTLATAGVAEAFTAMPEVSGTIPQTAARGYSLCGALRSSGAVKAFAVTPEVSGTIPQTATQGYSVCGTLRSGGVDAATVYTGKPSKSGVVRCGTMP